MLGLLQFISRWLGGGDPTISGSAVSQGCLALGVFPVEREHLGKHLPLRHSWREGGRKGLVWYQPLPPLRPNLMSTQDQTSLRFAWALLELVQ